MKYIIVFLLSITAVQAQKKPVVKTAAAARIYNIKDIPGLEAALASKQNAIANGNDKQLLRGDGALITAPTALSNFSDDIGILKKYFQFITRTGNFTLSIPDDGKFINVISSVADTVTLPSVKNVPFKVGTQITINQAGAGPIVFAVEPGVRLLTVKNGIKLVDINSVATAILKEDNTWQVIGDLQP